MVFPNIEEVATKSVVALDSEVSIKEAADIITEKKIRNLVIFNKLDSLYYVLSVGDMVGIATHEERLLESVSTLNLKHLPICSKDANILEAFMLFGKDTAIVGVVDNENNLCGVVTYSNLLNAVYGFDDDSLSQPVGNLLEKDSVSIVSEDGLLSEYLADLERSTTDCLIVADSESRPKGIITKRDIAKFLSKNINIRQNVKELMASPVISVDSQLSINKALAFMQDKKLKRVIVVGNDGKLSGVITQKELLDAIYSKLTQKGLFSLTRLNEILQEQVNLRTLELQQLNKELADRIAKEVQKSQNQEKMIFAHAKQTLMSEMIQAISHHWRQPLNVLAINIQDLPYAYNAKEVDDKYLQDFVSQNMNIVNSISKTIDNFRDFFSPNEEKEVFCVEEAILQTIKIVLPQMESGDINLQYQPIGTTAIAGYKNEFKHVLVNLISNASDAIQSGNSALKLIKIYVTNDSSAVHISVEDSGGGIPEDIMGRLFEPYFTTKGQGKGVGLGLYMAKGLVERHFQGELSVENGIKGARFTIKLPLKAH